MASGKSIPKKQVSRKQKSVNDGYIKKIQQIYDLNLQVAKIASLSKAQHEATKEIVNCLSRI